MPANGSFAANSGHSKLRAFLRDLIRRTNAQVYSNDLRVRVIQVVEGGAAARAAARQFVIGDSTAVRWTKRWRKTGISASTANQ